MPRIDAEDGILANRKYAIGHKLRMSHRGNRFMLRSDVTHNHQEPGLFARLVPGHPHAHQFHLPRTGNGFEVQVTQLVGIWILCPASKPFDDFNPASCGIRQELAQGLPGQLGVGVTGQVFKGAIDINDFSLKRCYKQRLREFVQQIA